MLLLSMYPKAPLALLPLCCLHPKGLSPWWAAFEDQASHYIKYDYTTDSITRRSKYEALPARSYLNPALDVFWQTPAKWRGWRRKLQDKILSLRFDKVDVRNLLASNHENSSPHAPERVTPRLENKQRELRFSTKLSKDNPGGTSSIEDQMDALVVVLAVLDLVIWRVLIWAFTYSQHAVLLRRYAND